MDYEILPSGKRSRSRPPFLQLSRAVNRALNAKSPTTSETGNLSLQALGKRVERLFFVALILMALGFIEFYLATANLQFSQDRSTAAIDDLIDRMETAAPQLEALMTMKPLPPVETSRTERVKITDQRYIETRKRLGLPLERSETVKVLTPAPPSALPSYPQALNRVIDDTIRSHPASADDLQRYRDPKRASLELIAEMKSAKDQSKMRPGIVWGIQTPRLINLKYAGLDYQFPYEFLASVIAGILGPFLAGWLGVVYATRQRELSAILEATDFKEVFPHVLNFIPVRFKKFESPEIGYSKATERGNVIAQALVRIVVVAVLVLPILYAHLSTLMQLGLANDYELPSILYASAAFTCLAFLQMLVLILQECFGLKNKTFIEG